MDQKEFHRFFKRAEEKLKAAGIHSAPAEIEVILEYLLKTDRLNLYLDGAALIDESIIEKFDSIVEKRATRYPLQYILGESWFYGRRFTVSPDVMVPTPETELLCDLAINYLRNEKLFKADILDIGVGSGVVSITMAAERPGTKITAVDISPEAIEVARANAARLGVLDRISFLKSDCFDSVNPDMKFDLILSNPPYISEGEYAELPPEVLADPRISLVSGEKGMDFIMRLMANAPDFLRTNGRLMFEIGYNQADPVYNATNQDRRYRSIAIMKDLNDIDRVVILSI